MLWRTHAVMGLVTGYLLTGGDPGLTVLAGASALLPDIDHPSSKIGRMVPVLPTMFRWTVGHRGIFHSLAAAFAFGLLATTLWDKDIGLVVVAGYLIHLIGDALTYSGLPLLWPLRFQVRLPLVKTGGFLERFVVFPGGAIGLMGVFLGPVVEKYL